MEVSSDHGNCRYRTRRPDGTALSCAVGCLLESLPDEEVAEAEGVPVGMTEIVGGRWQGIGRKPHALAQLLNVAGVPATDEVQTILMRLQRIHDRFEPATWPAQLSTLELETFGGAA